MIGGRFFTGFVTVVGLTMDPQPISDAMSICLSTIDCRRLSSAAVSAGIPGAALLERGLSPAALCAEDT